ncbi:MULTISPECIES: trypsin-like peptidase domain-containing protein [unclassified Roseibium]|uniref:trypsin-like peptidase domain-containing protein n=1 Tax=unclassified Roseibium TaxID=2629323 RepID=UPI00273F1FB6|nr:MULTISPECIES: trypsin-like peptidase domain-containing protein [unclassified Roseibium]
MSFFEANDDLYPNQAVAYIIAEFPDGSKTQGSGALIGNNDLLTASHVVYDRDRGGSASYVDVYFSYDVDDGFHPLRNGVRVNYKYVLDNNDTARFSNDIAIVSLSYAAGLEFGYFGLKTGFIEGAMTILGYPGSAGGNLIQTNGWAYKDFDDGVIRSLAPGSGNSGGPAFVYHDGTPRVQGIYNGSAAFGDFAGVITPIDPHYEWITNIIDNNDHLITSVPGTNQVIITPDPIDNNESGDPDPVVLAPIENVYRFFNPDTGSHFFATGNTQRSTTAINNPGWSDEGAAFQASTTASSGTVPVVRMYNEQSGRYLFTANNTEISIIQTQGWTTQEIGVWYVTLDLDSSLGYTTGVYRLYVPALQGHVYSSNITEISILLDTLDANNEGAAYYINPSLVTEASAPFEYGLSEDMSASEISKLVGINSAPHNTDFL